MCNAGISRVSLAALIVVLVTTTSALSQQVDYARAERFLSWHTSGLIAGDEVNPQWIENGDRFWYRNKTGSGYQFVVVDPARNTQGPLFDHYRMAAAMSLAADTSFNPDKLPFSTFEFVRGEAAIEFATNKKRFECDLRAYTCTVEQASEVDEMRLRQSGGGGGGGGGGGQWKYVESPDERWEAFIHEFNVWIRPHGGGDSTQLTTDGEQHWAYGYNEARPDQQRQGGRGLRWRRPQLVWSPDSRRIVVRREDERNVEHMHYLSMTAQRPRHFSQPYALPGDSIIPYPGFQILTLQTDLATDGSNGDGGPGVETASVSVTSVRAASNITPEVDPRPHQLSFNGSAPDSAWSVDGSKVYVTYFTRGSKSVFLAEVDAATGQSRVIVADSAKTFVELSQRGPASWYVGESGDDVIWWSERDGWAHLYRFDLRGNLKNRITSGPWTVGTVHFVDDASDVIYFTARGREAGRNIYYAHLYRVNFDGTDLQLLTPEDGDHTIDFTPSGRYFVDSYSKIDTPPVTVLRSTTDGRILRTLEEADITRLEEIGFKSAQVFTVKARDGVTDLYGVVYLPPNVDSTKKYPIISHIYPGPQVGSVGSWQFKDGGEDFALAQLGFVVIQLDHLGTPLRSKAFHDNYYGNFIDNGIPDHVTAIKQLGARYPFIDLDRVGIYGHSGGGFASTDAMLRFPEFFKVAVSGAGNHDNRTYNIYWAEKYQGLMKEDTLRQTDNFENAANKTYAKNLRGKLLLMHGDMDDNVHPANTIQLVDELIKANKDFDLIVAPNRAHGLNEPYFIRRRWDYFVQHLLGAEPPKEYEIKRPEN